MKAIERLNNVEKAKLLFALFPSEIAPFIRFVKSTSKTIREEEPMLREQWDNGLITLDY